MGKFKPGDKVRRLIGNVKFKKDDIVTVLRYTSDNNFLVEEDPMGDWQFEGYVELVTPAPTSNEELLKKLNEGMEARQELNKRGVLEVFSKNENKFQLARNNYEIPKYRLKPKYEITPFTVNQGQWRVSVNGDTLHIGCKDFDLRDFHTQLIYLITDNSANSNMFISTKKGIKYNDHLLPWSDAEKILQELNKLMENK